MLLTLARRISDQFLPEVFYESTFTTAEGCPQRSAEEEEELAMGLDHKMQEIQGALGEMAGLGDEDGSEWKLTWPPVNSRLSHRPRLSID
jgi:hypothetical protein